MSDGATMRNSCLARMDKGFSCSAASTFRAKRQTAALDTLRWSATTGCGDVTRISGRHGLEIKSHFSRGLSRVTSMTQVSIKHDSNANDKRHESVSAGAVRKFWKKSVTKN